MKPSRSNFVTAITNADVTGANKTWTLGTLNMDLNLQNRKEKCFCGVHTDISLNTFLHLGKRQHYSFLFDVKNTTLHFVDLERSLKSFLTSQDVMCLLTLFSSEEMAIYVFWLIVHVHRNEKRVNDVAQ